MVDRLESYTPDEMRQIIAGMDPERKRQLVARFNAEKEARRTLWECKMPGCDGAPHDKAPTPHARRKQHFNPTGDEIGQIILAGRGFGKTRTGAETVRKMVMEGRASKIGLIARTAADARDVMVGANEPSGSGLMHVFPRWQRPTYVASQRKLYFHNGAVATLYSSEEPDQLRGPEHDFVWGDEMSTWKKFHETISNAQMGLRHGEALMLLTGTPRPTKEMRKLLDGGYGDFKIITGTTYENAHNLSVSWRNSVITQYEGTRTGQQELMGIMLEDIEGALLTHADLDWEGFRPTTVEPGALSRVIVAVDPAVTAETKSDHTGIVVFGVTADRQHGYVLHSERIKERPHNCMRYVGQLYDRFHADAVVAEDNNGKLYVTDTLREVRPDIKVEGVHASRGKLARAEPVAALYEQKRIHHVGHPANHAALEGEWTTWVPPGTKDADGLSIPSGDSPDVMDAVVWAAFKTMLGPGRRQKHDQSHVNS